MLAGALTVIRSDFYIGIRLGQAAPAFEQAQDLILIPNDKPEAVIFGAFLIGFCPDEERRIGVDGVSISVGWRARRWARGIQRKSHESGSARFATGMARISSQVSVV
jgi:hypothetical protein